MAYSTGMIRPRVNGENGQALAVVADSEGVSQLGFVYPPVFVHNTSDIATTTTSAASVACTSLAFAVVSNAHYMIDGVLLIQCSLATDGFQMALSFSGTALSYAGIAGITQLANAGTTNMFYGDGTTYRNSVSGVPANNTTVPVLVKGMVVTTKYKGNIVPRLKVETGGTDRKVTIKQFSSLVVKRIK